MVQEEEVRMGTRRRFTPEFTARVILELISGVKTVAEACREYQLTPQLLARWKGAFLDDLPPYNASNRYVRFYGYVFRTYRREV